MTLAYWSSPCEPYQTYRGKKRLNIAEDGPKIGQRSPKIAQDEPKIGPRWTREGLKITQDGPKKGSRSPKMSPRSPKMAKYRSHIAEDGLYVRWTRILRVRTRRKMAWTYVGPVFCGSERDGRAESIVYILQGGSDPGVHVEFGPGTPGKATPRAQFFI